MKNDDALRLGFTYAGCFLGAGYVSGQELWQFFGVYGLNGGKGMIFAILLFFGFGVLLLRLIQRTGLSQADELIVRPHWPFLRGIVGLLQEFFLFGIFVIMAAGVGALTEQILGLSALWGSIAFCLLVMGVSLSGTRGMMNVFSFVVPLLVICSVLISLIAVARYGWGNIRISNTTSGSGNPLLGNWVLAAFTYVAYNLFGSIGVLAPVGGMISSKRTVYGGILVGCIVLFAIAGGIFLALHTDLAVTSTQLPMLVIAREAGTFWYYLYAVLLFGGMFGTSLSCMVAAQHYGYQKMPGMAHHRIVTAANLAAIAWAGSLFGFGGLVSTVYPITGYCGALAIVGLVLHDIAIRREQRKLARQK